MTDTTAHPPAGLSAERLEQIRQRFESADVEQVCCNQGQQVGEFEIECCGRPDGIVRMDWDDVKDLLVELSRLRAALETAVELKPLTSRERHKGTGDVLKDLAHAQRMTDVDEPGFGEVICRGNELRFVNRAIRVAMGEIKQMRARHQKAAEDPCHG